MKYILKVKNLTKKYAHSAFSLDQVSFGVPYGSIVGFVGENGAGKTTTISCIMNLLTKDSGTVSLFGKEMTDCDRFMREDIGVVLDAATFSEQLNGWQLSKIMQGIYSRWEHQDFVHHMKRFQVPMDKKLKTLSRGMLTKLSIAVTLSHHAKMKLQVA